MRAKVILLTETISPYRIPLFNEIAGHLGEQFLVLFFGETEKRRLWRIYKEKIRFRYEVLMHLLLQKKGLEPYFLNPTILYKLMKYSPSVIIVSGYYNPSSLLAMLYAKCFYRRIILWCESNKYEQRLNYPLTEAYKRWFVRNCTEYIVPGKASFEYLLSLRAAVEKIWIAPNAVDNDYFRQACDKYRETKEAFKKAKGYSEKIILYVGRLIDRKGILDLLKAFQILSREQLDLGLLLVGSGEGEKRYKNFCKTNNIKNVFFEGFVHQEELPAYYAASDVFVLPTHSDPWGLVLNEAMVCKLPIISSDVAGAAYDLIINGENGYRYEKGNIGELIETLKKVLNSDRKSMGMKSYEIIQNFSPQRCAAGFLQVIAYKR
jgi:glycosyltransferase involved in cell wall biosynthesis